jgi:proteasome lid subunit RPN8/RPN11
MEPDEEFDISPRVVPPVSPPGIPAHLVDAATDVFTLFVSDFVINGVREYLAGDQKNELGGCLHGRRSQTEGRTVVEITDFTPLPSKDRGSAHFVFGFAAKEHMVRMAKARSDQIVGWFHSHPRMGDPFMSLEDRDLHRRDYNKFWQVSLVVAVGEWGMPIGFWRMDQDRLIWITNYYVVMTTGPNVGDADRRFLRASFGDGAPMQVALSRVGRILIALDEPVFANIIQSKHDALSGTDGLSLLKVMTSLTQSVANGEVARERVENLVARLGNAYTLQQRTHPLLVSEHLNHHLAVVGDWALTFSRGGKLICVADFKNNVVLARRLTEDVLAGTAHPASHRVWLLLDNGLLISFGITRSDDESTDPGAKRAPNRSDYEIISELSDPLDLAARSDHLLIKSAENLIKWPLSRGDHNGTGDQQSEASEKKDAFSLRQVGGEWMLVHHYMDSDLTLLRRNGASLELVGDQLQILAAGEPLAELEHWQIVRAVATPSGIWLLLDRMSIQQIVKLRHDLSAIERIIFADVDELPGRVTDLAVDADHRVLASACKSILLISETGAPNVSWHHDSV